MPTAMFARMTGVALFLLLSTLMTQLPPAPGILGPDGKFCPCEGNAAMSFVMVLTVLKYSHNIIDIRCHGLSY